MPWRSWGRRTTASLAPTSRMISVSARRTWSTRVVAVVTVRMAASASTAPTARPTTWKSRCQRARPSTHSAPPCTSSDSGSAASCAASARVASGVVAPSAGVTSSEAGSGLRGR
jgi:hypothetical protein